MAEFDWNRERNVLRGPFPFFDNTMIFESLEVDSAEATALLRITYTGNDPLLQKGRGHPLVPPLHLHFKQSETFKVIQGQMAAVVGYDEKEVIISSEDEKPYEIRPYTPHTPYCYGGDVDTIVLIRAHPAKDEDLLGALFFEHLFRHLDEAHRARKAPDVVQVMVMQHATDSALVMFPSAWFLGSLRWVIPWALQASVAKVASMFFGYTPEIKKFMHQE
ncbi:putative rmlC-like cupin domain superfamily, rmlC-like jelly roll protein [Septoria linicola]|nr:putative rmlC-like cupin domain superfamily, rmlC-like jelly roll protein [Septoria linicola]